MEVIGAESEEPVDSSEILDLINDYKDKNNVFIQVFNPSLVVGKEHLIWAYNKAKKTFENENNRASDIGIETLLWASAEWQIKNALKKMGIQGKIKKIAMITDADINDLLDHLDFNRNDDILMTSEKKLKEFGIEYDDVAPVERPEDLIFEKMATSIL